MTSAFLVTIGPTTVSAAVTAKGEISWSGQFTWESPDELRDLMSKAEVESRPHRTSTRLRVEIEGELLQQRLLPDLPPVSPHELETIVARGTSRFFRQNGHQLVSGAVWAASEKNIPRYAVAMAIDGLVVDAVLLGSSDAGLQVDDIVPAAGLATLSLLPVAERFRRGRAAWVTTLKLGIATLLLWLAILGGIAGYRMAKLTSIEDELLRLREPRAALQVARFAMDSARVMVAATDEAQGRRQLVGHLLGSIVDLLPDSAFFEELTIGADGSGTVSGKALQPSAMQRRLQGKDGLVGGSMRVTTQPGEGWSGFMAQWSGVR